MGFKDLFNEDKYYSELSHAIVYENHKIEDIKEAIKFADIKSKVSSMLGSKGVLGAATKVKEKLSAEETQKAFSIAGAAIDAINSVVGIMKGGDGSSGGGSNSGGGIFNSILRYNNPILKKITPEDTTLEAIEEILEKMNFDVNTDNIIDPGRFTKMFREFLRLNMLPSEDTYDDLHALLSGVEGIKVHKTDIAKKKAISKKETPEQEKARMIAEIAAEKEWESKFKEFLNNEKFSAETRILIAKLLTSYNIKLKMNVDEIKADLGVLFKKIFTRETLQFGASMSKALKNFVLVLVSVYLLKIIKKVAFS